MSESVAGSEAADVTTPPKPRVRAGAIAWGLIVIGVAVTVLVIVTRPESREAFADWLGAATPAGIAIVAVLAIGVLILLLAGLALIRRAQRR